MAAHHVLNFISITAYVVFPIRMFFLSFVFNKRLVKTIKSYFKLPCHGRNKFYYCMPVTADEHSLYLGKINHSASLLTVFAEMQLVYVGSDRPTVTESLSPVQCSNLIQEPILSKQDPDLAPEPVFFKVL